MISVTQSADAPPHTTTGYIENFRNPCTIIVYFTFILLVYPMRFYSHSLCGLCVVCVCVCCLYTTIRRLLNLSDGPGRSCNFHFPNRTQRTAAATATVAHIPRQTHSNCTGLHPSSIQMCQNLIAGLNVIRQTSACYLQIVYYFAFFQFEIRYLAHALVFVGLLFALHSFGSRVQHTAQTGEHNICCSVSFVYMPMQYHMMHRATCVHVLCALRHVKRFSFYSDNNKKKKTPRRAYLENHFCRIIHIVQVIATIAKRGKQIDF